MIFTVYVSMCYNLHVVSKEKHFLK